METLRSLRQIIWLGIVMLIFTSCSTRGIRLRNKSIEKWEELERKQAEEKSKLDSSAVKTQSLKTEDHE